MQMLFSIEFWPSKPVSLCLQFDCPQNKPAAPNSTATLSTTSFLDANVLSTKQEDILLAQARNAEPLAKEGKSLLQRTRSSNKKAKKPKAAKKPACEECSLSKSSTWVPKARLKGKQSSPAPAEVSAAEAAKAEPVAPPKSSSLRKRALSTAYHKAHTATLKAALETSHDMTPEELADAKMKAKKAAQEAYKAAALKFDAEQM